jgi:restriction system protein
MEPVDFEDLVSRLLTAIGFEMVEVTKYSGDGGIDVRGVLVIGDVIRMKMAVQAKRWKNHVQAPAVQQMRGSLGAHEQGLIITTSDFSKGAKNEAIQVDKTPIALMSGEQLVTLLMEYSIGVRSTPQVLFDLEEHFLHPQ